MTSETTALEPRWLDDDEQCAWRSFLVMQARLNTRLGREMQEQSGLSHADFAVLVQLSERPDERMRVLELARALEWEKSRLSHQLTRMEQRALLCRSGCTEDRRGAFVVLTDAGRDAVRAAAPSHVGSVRRHFFDRLTHAQVQVLHEISRTVLDGLEHGPALEG